MKKIYLFIYYLLIMQLLLSCSQKVDVEQLMSENEELRKRVARLEEEIMQNNLETTGKVTITPTPIVTVTSTPTSAPSSVPTITAIPTPTVTQLPKTTPTSTPKPTKLPTPIPTPIPVPVPNHNSLVISSVNPELTVKDNTGNVILLKYIEDDDDIYLLPKPFILDIDVNDTEGKKILWGRLFEITFVYYNKETKEYRLDTRLFYYPNDSRFYFNGEFDDNEIFLGAVFKRDRDKETSVDDLYDLDIEYIKTDLLNYALCVEERAILNLETELLANDNVPMKVIETWVSNNSIGTPEVGVSVKNLSDKTIIAFEIELYCYDDFNRPVNRISNNSNKYTGISQGKRFTPGNTYSCYWNLSLYDLTTNVKNVKITRVAFSDGTYWEE